MLFNRAPYVPTSSKVVKSIIDNIPIKKGAVVYDLGCGDARFLIAAEKKYQIKGKGYEISTIPFTLAWLNKIIHRSKVSLYLGNFFKKEIHDADMIFCYLYPETMVKVAEKIRKECKKGTKLVSNTFRIKDMTPIKIIENKVFLGDKVYLYEF